MYNISQSKCTIFIKIWWRLDDHKNLAGYDRNYPTGSWNLQNADSSAKGMATRRLRPIMQEWPLDATRLQALAAKLVPPRLHVTHNSWSIVSSNGRWTCKGGIITHLSIAVLKLHSLLHDLLQLLPHRSYKMKTRKTKGEVGKKLPLVQKATISRIPKFRTSITAKTLSFIH